MPISKIKTSSITADAASVSLNIDAGTLYLDAANNYVGVGTTSPSHQLDVANGARANYLQVKNGGYAGSGATTPEIYSPSAATLVIAGGGAERLRIDANGNIGINVVPKTNWGSTWKAVQLGSQASWYTNNDFVRFGLNVYGDTSYNEKFLTADHATQYIQASGMHSWMTGGPNAGTQDSVIPWTTVLTLDAYGNATHNGANYQTATNTGITITDHGNNYNTGDVQSYIKFTGRYWSGDDNTGGGGAQIALQKGAPNGNTGSQLAFYTTSLGGSMTQKMLLDGNGRLTVGTANYDADSLLTVNQALTIANGSALALKTQMEVDSTTFYISHNQYYSSGSWNLYDSSRAPASIEMTSASNNSSIVFRTKAANSGGTQEAARITSTGDLVLPPYTGSFVMNDDSGGIYKRSVSSGYFSTSTTWRIGLLNSWYWGTGGVTLRITHSSYTGFDFAEFVLYGHTDRPSGSSISYYTKIPWTVGGQPSPTIMPVVYQSTNSNSPGYSEIRLACGPYQQYRVEIISPMYVFNVAANLSNYDASWTNTFAVFPNNTIV